MNMHKDLEELESRVFAHEMLLKHLIEYTPVEVRQAFGQYVASFRDRALAFPFQENQLDQIEEMLQKLRT